MLTVRNAKQFDWGSLSLEECATGNALDASYTLRIYDILVEKLKENGSLHLFGVLLSPLFSAFAQIEHRGLEVNPSELDGVGENLRNLLDDIEDKLYRTSKVDKRSNLKSTQDLVRILYSDEGFALYPPVMTEKGKPSTNKQCLDILLDQIDAEIEKRAKKKS
jgi:DNA polymerase I-like protein with 3'-5' exonuclease and polymerase domains